MLSEKDRKWAKETWKKLDDKLSVVSVRSKEKIPFWSHDGMHDDMTKSNINCWTNGFWPGLMWLMYSAEKKECYKAAAEWSEEQLDKALLNHVELSHDVGFIWRLASGFDYAITGSNEARNRQFRAADHLMSRFNPAGGGFIRAWNHGDYNPALAGWTIIDCMMNLPLLYWASEETDDPRFRFVAESHADMVLRDHFRPDGSVKHVVNHNPFTGEALGDMDDTQGQGFGSGSAWSRGQSWALYGMVLSYIHTGKEEYLDAAKRSAHYFISSLSLSGWLPLCDFRAPLEPVYYDTSAGMCAACGMIEIAKHVPEYEKHSYVTAALNMLKAVEKEFADWSHETDFIIGGASGSYKDNEHRHMNIIYADYYFAEALYKLLELGNLEW